MLLEVILFAVSISTVKGNETHMYVDEHILDGILKNYDRRILPTKDGLPVKVEVRVNVADMAEQKSIHSHYGIEIVVHAYWNDFRLRFNSTEVEEIRLAGKHSEFLWVPDFTFEEKIGVASKITTDNKFAAIFPQGDVLLSQRLILTLFCPMDFTRFPFDDQECKLPVLSSSYNDAQMNLSWMSTSGGKQLPGVVFRKDPSQLDGIFLIEDYSYGKEKRSFGESETYDVLVIELHFHRRFSYYFVRIYMPLILIVTMSFSAFWIEYRSTPARTIMATTIILTAVTFIVSIQDSLPPTTSIRSIDLYSLSCFIFVFATLVEFAFVQTVDVQVKIIERKYRKLRNRKLASIDEDGTSSGNSLHLPRSVSSPVTVIDDLEMPELKVHGIFGPLLTRIYKAHLKHRAEYHVLDRFAQRFFPLTFIVLNILYFGMYLNHV